MIKFMKAILVTGFFIFGFYATSFTQTTENITVTTYYPSPFGVYRVMRLQPGARPAGVCTQGDMYYDNGAAAFTRGIYTCDNTSTWQRYQLWQTTPANVNDINNLNTGNVGIGTATPARKLDVVGSGRYSTSLDVGGAATVGGTLGVTGISTFTGDVRANGGITCVDCISLSAETQGNYAAGDAEAGRAINALQCAGDANCETNGVTSNGNIFAVGAISTNSRFISSMATGTPPITVNSTTQVSNLNVDLLDVLHSTGIQTCFTPANATHADSAAAVDGIGNWTAIKAYIDGSDDVGITQAAADVRYMRSGMKYDFHRVDTDTKVQQVAYLNGTCAEVTVNAWNEDGSSNCWTTHGQGNECYWHNRSTVILAVSDGGIGHGWCEYNIIGVGCDNSAAITYGGLTSGVAGASCDEQGGCTIANEPFS